MADIVTPEVRSRMMSGIRGRDTKLEVKVRRALHGLGLRYRLQDRRVPGRPDLVLPRYRAAVFVHGCFWHGHDCSLFRMPASRREFWESKINANRARDRKVSAEIAALGWRQLVIWECAVRGRERVGLEQTAAEAAGWIRSGAPSHEIRGRQEIPS